MSIIPRVDTMGSYTYSNNVINAPKKNFFNLSIPKWNWINVMKSKWVPALKETII